MVKPGCLLECTPCLLTLIVIAVTIPLVELRIIVSDHFEITLEESMVRDIESGNGRIKPDICFGKMLPE